MPDFVHERRDPEVAWREVWAQLAELRGLTPASERFPVLAAELQVIARQERQDPRGQLLAVHLLRLGPRAEPDALLDPPEVDARPFEGIENWLAAEVLAPGPERARAVVQGLLSGEVGRSGIELAYRLGLEDAENLRLGDALVVQEALHAHQRADWSAGNLALTLRKLGRYEDADRALLEQILLDPGSMGAASLWNDRGLTALGRGATEVARSYLGKALALGSDDAGMVLAVLDLGRGRIHAARAEFRALVSGPAPGAWSLRGWGLSLLADPGRGAAEFESPPHPPRTDPR